MKGRKTPARGESRSETKLLDLPIVEGLIANQIDGQVNLIPKSLLGERLPYYAPPWQTDTPNGENDRLQAFWDDTGMNWADIPQPVGERQLLHVNHVYLSEEGPHDIWYQVTGPDSVPQGSHRLRVWIDLTAPVLNDPGELVFADIPPEGITSAYLESKGQVLPATLNFNEAKEGDVVTVYWDAAEGENNPALRYEINNSDEGTAITLEIPAQAIKDAGDGERMVRYRVADRAGNDSEYAGYVKVKVSLEDESNENRMAPPFLYDEDVADPSDGTIKSDVVFAEQGLRVRIPAWANLPGAGEEDTVYLNWADGHDEASAEFEAVAMITVPGPATPDQFPKEIILEHNHLLPDGPFMLNYAVQIWTGDPPEFSRVLKVISDITPPWGNEYPHEAIVPEEPITDAYFAANPTGMQWQLPEYPGFQAGDTVHFWWLATLPDTVVGIPATGTVPVTQPPMMLEVPKADIEETGDGVRYLVYVLVDKVNNQSNLSVVAQVNVALGNLPDALGAPVFPQAEQDGLIDLLDAHEGVMIGIPQYQNAKPTDVVMAKWANFTLGAEDVGSAPGWPLKIRVPNYLLETSPGTAPGPHTIEVSYVVVRGGIEFGPETASVMVDLSVPGPELPDWPNPINGNLGLGTLTGPTSQKPNELDRTDSLQDAPFTFPMYANPVVGEVVQVYWGNVMAVEYAVNGTETEGDDITVMIPWAVIEQVNNTPALDVHYRIGSATSPNEQRSGMTVVKVDAVVLVPEAPLFLNIKGPEGVPMLTCGSLVEPDYHLEVDVPDLSKWLVAGNTVTLKWMPCDEKDGPLLEDAVLIDPIVLNAEQLRGFVWKIAPYETHIAPTYESPENPIAWGVVVYEFEFEGYTVTSSAAEIEVRMFGPGGPCIIE